MTIQPKHVFADTLCVALSASLAFGGSLLHDFAYYTLLIIMSFGGLALFVGGVKGDAAEAIRSRVWWSGALSAIQISALIYSGHPLMAAASLTLSMFIVGSAFADKKA